MSSTAEQRIDLRREIEGNHPYTRLEAIAFDQGVRAGELFFGREPDLPDIEVVAAKVHESWMLAKLALDISTRKSETGEELMVPYRDLSESAKEVDRITVRTVYEAIRGLGSRA